MGFLQEATSMDYKNSPMVVSTFGFLAPHFLDEWSFSKLIFPSFQSSLLLSHFIHSWE